MQSKLFWIYSKRFIARTGAQWRIIQVREEDERDDMPSLFVLCTKKKTSTAISVHGKIII